jgi:hypothetical protein
MNILEPQPQNVNQANELLQAVLTAAAAGDGERVLAGVSRMAGQDPMRVEAMRGEPGLEPVRAQVDSLLVRLATIAKLDAQGRIAQATQLIEENRLTALRDWDADPRTLLMVANRLVEAGGYGNAVRGTQVAQLLVDPSHWGPAVDTISKAGAPEAPESEESRPVQGAILPVLSESWRGLRGRGAGRVARLWRRAPLLVLLLAWLVAGTAGGLMLRILQTLRPGVWPSWISDAGVTVWAVGFLGLVLFGFYMRVRNIRL